MSGADTNMALVCTTSALHELQARSSDSQTHSTHCFQIPLCNLLFSQVTGAQTDLLQSKSFYLRLKLSLVKHSLMDSNHGFGWWRVSRSLPAFSDVLDPLCPLFMMLLLQALILHKRKSQERCYDEQQ